MFSRHQSNWSLGVGEGGSNADGSNCVWRALHSTGVSVHIVGSRWCVYFCSRRSKFLLLHFQCLKDLVASKPSVILVKMQQMAAIFFFGRCRIHQFQAKLPAPMPPLVMVCVYSTWAWMGSPMLVKTPSLQGSLSLSLMSIIALG